MELYHYTKIKNLESILTLNKVRGKLSNTIRFKRKFVSPISLTKSKSLYNLSHFRDCTVRIKLNEKFCTDFKNLLHEVDYTGQKYLSSPQYLEIFKYILIDDSYNFQLDLENHLKMYYKTSDSSYLKSLDSLFLRFANYIREEEVILFKDYFENDYIEEISLIVKKGQNANNEQILKFNELISEKCPKHIHSYIEGVN